MINSFIVNKYLSLKLENGKTIIYVNEKQFIQCRYLLLNIPLQQIYNIQTFFNIDNFADEELEYNEFKHKIPPELEFWGHSSNLQVWYEYEYDTRLLHRNLAFPLLKELSEVGDPLAKKVFKEEIASRLINGHPTVVAYLLEENYLLYFRQDEILIILENIEAEQIIEKDPKLLFLLLNKYSKEEVDSSIKWLEKLKTIKELRVEGHKLTTLRGIEHFTNLELLNLNENKLTEICGIESLKELKELNLNGNQIKEIKGLEDLVKLEELYLTSNLIKEITGLETLKKLETLSLGGNQIQEIKGLESLKKLKSLALGYNLLTEVKGLDNIKNLEFLGLEANKLNIIKGLENLINLKSLNLSYNQLTELNGLDNLQNLQSLYFQNNQLTEINTIFNLRNLKELRLSNNRIPKKLIDQLRISSIKIFD